MIPILVLLPLLSQENISVATALGGSLANAVIALAIIFAIGRFFIATKFIDMLPK